MRGIVSLLWRRKIKETKITDLPIHVFVLEIGAKVMQYMHYLEHRDIYRPNLNDLVIIFTS